jgi:signal transduction histidine kinase
MLGFALLRRRASGRGVSGQSPLFTWTGAFLAATLGLSILLAYEAAASARSHRETAESVVRDYARVAVWHYTRRMARELSDLLERTFEEVPRRADGRLPPAEAIQAGLASALDRMGCVCPELAQPPLLLQLDLRNLSVVGWPETLSSDRLRRLADTIAAETRNGDWRGGLLLLGEGEVLPRKAVLAYSVLADSIGPAFAYLVAFDASKFGATFAAGYRSGGLLPATIMGQLPNDSLARVAVRSWHGTTLYQSAPPDPGAVFAADTMLPLHGRLIVETAIRPEAVSRLIIGGMPRSRLGLIVTLLALTVGVSAAAALQLRRERQLLRLREAFVSGVSHELRTPLAQIRMFGELQEEGKLRNEEERTRAVSVINREAQRLSHLVENILRFSRLRYTSEAGSVREPIGVAEMVGHVLDGFRALATARRMTVHTEIGQGLAVIANRDALHHVLVNLLDNAVKYGPPGQRIRIAAEPRGKNTWIAVEDAGPGVPLLDRERIWEPYVRLQRDLDAHVPGTGIGLAVVAQLVAANGGRAWVEDGPGGGARFVIELISASCSLDDAAPGAGSRKEVTR